MLECRQLSEPVLAYLDLLAALVLQPMDDSMPRCTFSLRMLRALSLAFLMVWLWQTSALLTGIEAPTAVANAVAGLDAGKSLATSSSCVLCTADNQSSSTADHAHEPPSLTAAYLVAALPRVEVPSASILHRQPMGFIEPIERPPRSFLLI